MGDPAPRLGVVVIGRNEGARLVRCLDSIARLPVGAVVYVDSGSTDGSVAAARARGAQVVDLDLSLPFTAARGRNAGFAALRAAHPDLAFVQFVDGDCELAAGWLETAAAYLAAHPDVAVVFGRRRERHPDASPWNRCADVEWDGVPGETDACGGDAMLRASVLEAVGGYDATLIAGEEPELCHRIRATGARVVRLADEMTLHDAALLRFGQWWRRQARGGHAYAETTWRHRGRPDPRRARQVASVIFWAALLPATAVLLAVPTRGAGLLLLAALAWPWRGLYRAARRLRPASDDRLYATVCLIGKFAELQGIATFAWNHGVRGRATGLIEYKGAERSGSERA